MSIGESFEHGQNLWSLFRQIEMTRQSIRFSASRIKVFRMLDWATFSRHFRPYVIMVFFLPTLLAACQPPTPTPTLPPTATDTPSPKPTLQVESSSCNPDQEWSLIFTASGGFAGQSVRLELDSDGSFIATDEKIGQSVKANLSPDDLLQISQLLQAVCPFREIGPSPTCADCFLYSLELFIGEEQYRSSLNDLALPSSGFQVLINALNKIIN